jgi:N-carbamoyl-L-amino-acid hydrolase
MNLNKIFFFSILFYFFLGSFANSSASPDNLPKASPERMEARILELSKFGKNSTGGTSRVAYSDGDIEGRKYIKTLMKNAGLMVRIDEAANIIGSREGLNPNLPIIMFGSHTDSVPDGGNYDGDVGVMAALEAIEILNEAGITTRHPIQVIDFTDEEGGLVGSLALTGRLKEETLNFKSHSGYTIAEGIDRLGGDHKNLKNSQYEIGAIKAFIEVHIEQGGFLDAEGLDIGVVEGIVGIHWWDITIDGFANHAGTTPMDKRQDAMVTAAKMVLAINDVGLNTEGRQVATVGRIKAEPGAPNVIPGRVIMSLEVRDLDLRKMESVFKEIKKRLLSIAHDTDTKVSFDKIEIASEPAPTDLRVRKIIEASTQKLGLSYKFMPSGAGHDAQDMVHIAPTGMIFVPSKGGISHAPQEYTKPQDMANGANVLVETILNIDKEKGES